MTTQTTTELNLKYMLAQSLPDEIEIVDPFEGFALQDIPPLTEGRLLFYWRESDEGSRALVTFREWDYVVHALVAELSNDQLDDYTAALKHECDGNTFHMPRAPWKRRAVAYFKTIQTDEF